MVLAARHTLCAHGIHHLLIAHSHHLIVDQSAHAVARHLFHIGHGAASRFVGEGVFQRNGYRVIAVSLHMGGKVKQLLLADEIGVQCRDGKFAMGEGASFVEHRHAHLRQRLQIIGAFYQNATA